MLEWGVDSDGCGGIEAGLEAGSASSRTHTRAVCGDRALMKRELENRSADPVNSVILQSTGL